VHKDGYRTSPHLPRQANEEIDEAVEAAGLCLQRQLGDLERRVHGLGD
jgi:hypothetical protein